MRITYVDSDGKYVCKIFDDKFNKNIRIGVNKFK